MWGHKHDTLMTAEQAQRLIDSLETLRAELGADRQQRATQATADQNQMGLMVETLARVFGQLDALERYLLATDPNYPRDRWGGHSPLAERKV